MVSIKEMKMAVEKAIQNEEVEFDYGDFVVTKGDVVHDIKSKLIADGLSETQAIKIIYRDMIAH